MFRLTMGYRSINFATSKMAWPIPHFQSVFLDVHGAKDCTVIQFCSGYWQLPRHVDSQHLPTFMVPNGVVPPTRRTQRGYKSEPNFQWYVEPCLATQRDHTLAWIDDFVIKEKDENEVPGVLHHFLGIFQERNMVVSIVKSRFYLAQVK